MYLCTICGLIKSELGSNPEFEFRRRRYPNEETHLEGMSDWCSKCEALRFFFKSDMEQEPRQHLEEQQQQCRKSKKRVTNADKFNKYLTQPNRITRRDAHKLVMQEIESGLPAQLPKGSLWERKLRSFSEDRAQTRRKINPVSERSRSQVNEPFKNIKLIQSNIEESSSTSSSARAALKIPLKQKQLEDLIRPWQESMQLKQQTLNEANAIKKPHKMQFTQDQMLNKVQELQAGDTKRQLKTELKEKKQQMLEWKRIRRHVDNEYDRVKTELNELKFQVDLDTEKQRRDKLAEEEKIRISGGAQIFANKTIDKAEQKKLNGKTIGDALDEKMEHMLDTLQEKEAKSVLKIPLENIVLKRSSSRAKRVLSKLNILVSTVQRARFRGFAEDPQELLKRLNQTELQNQREPPLPQFETLPCARQDLVNLLHIKREVLQPNRVRPLKVCRSPIYCPDCDCRRMFFISDFNEHLTHEHPSLAMERIAPCQAKTFFMDTQATQLNKAKCNMVYFVKDKFLDDNTHNHPDLLPILVMSARLRLTEIFSPNFDLSAQLCPYNYLGADNEIFLIWLTSVRPDDTKIIGTISVWPTTSNPKIECLLVHTNEVYNIRSSQKLKNIYNSNRIMALSGNFVSRLTAAGKNLLAVQVQIH